MPCPRITRIIAAAAALLLAGCLPIPHHEIMSPPLEGTVRAGGRPVADAHIYVGRGWCDFDEAPQAHTDAQGRFRMALGDEIVYFIAMDPGHPWWRLCIVQDGKRYLGWYERHPGDLRVPVKVECELTAPQPEGAADAPDPNAPDPNAPDLRAGVCRRVEDPPPQ